MTSKIEKNKFGTPLFFASVIGASFGGAIIGMFPNSSVASALGTMLICSFWGMLACYLLFGENGIAHGLTLGLFGGFIWGIFRPWEGLLKAMAVQDGGIGDAAIMAISIVVCTIIIALQCWLIGWIFGFGRDRRV